MMKLCAIFLSLILSSCASARLRLAAPEESTSLSSPEALRLKSQLQELKNKIFVAEDRGEPVACASQIQIEASWAFKFLGDLPRTQALIANLKQELAKSPPDRTLDLPSSTDGSWGTCYTEWIFKLADSGEHLLELASDGRSPKRRLTLLDRINSPERLTRYLESLLISDAPPAFPNRRRELNEAISILIRLIVTDLPANYPYHPELKKTLLSFVQNRWQDPTTGYWGAWYRKPDGSISKTEDLSITFHIVSYLEGEVQNLEPLFKTTLAIRGDTYPLGWLERGGYSNHHNYDVVRLLRYGWPKANSKDRSLAAREIRKMLDSFLSDGMDADGTLKISSSSDDSIEDAYYFAVSFLDEVGFLDPKKRFWTHEALEDPTTIRASLSAQIRAKMEKGGKSGLYYRSALRKLAI